MANQEIDDLKYNEFERDRYYNKDYGKYFNAISTQLIKFYIKDDF
jgi:hypothetical protein